MPRSIAFLLVPDFTHLAFSCAVEPLRIANLIAGRELYRWTLVSEDGKTATASNGIVTQVHRGFVPVARGESLFVISGIHVRDRISPALLAYLRRERVRGTDIGAICSGAWVLAKAGLLDGESAAIHWDFHDQFAESFPRVHLSRSVFATGGRHPTASGGTAAADMMLDRIRREQGEELATGVADQMVYNAVREGSAAQRVSLQSRHGMRNPHLRRAVALMEANLETPLSPQAIAAEIGISARQLERLFGRYLGATPKRYLMDLRLERARRMLVQSDMSVAEVAMAAGFNSSSHFSKVFRARFGQTPGGQRTRLS